jgi:hypothetical protein
MASLAIHSATRDQKRKSIRDAMASSQRSFSHANRTFLAFPSGASHVVVDLYRASMGAAQVVLDLLLLGA